MRELPLKGIRVIDHGVVYTGTAATTMLADMGAEVIRVESISRFPAWTRGVVARPPDPSFGYPESHPGERPWDRWYQLHATSRNKLGITLEMNQPRGAEIYKRLVAISDIIIENFSQGTMDRLGLGYDVLREAKPDIIMVSASGLGSVGPYQGYSTFGSNIDAFSGMMMLRGYPGDPPLMRDPSNVWADNVAAGTVAFAALAALYYRRKTGKGQYIDLSQAEAFIPQMGGTVLDYTINGKIPQATGNRDPGYAPQGCYRCKGQDMWVNISVVTQEQWLAFCRVLGNPEWSKAARLFSVSDRLLNHDELDVLIARWTMEHDRYEVMHLLQSAGIPAGPVLGPAGVYADPHLKERGFFREVTHREAGTHLYPGMCFKYDNTPVEIRIPAPCLGEHNDYVFGQLLGMTAQEIEQLKTENIIGDAYLPGVV